MTYFGVNYYLSGLHSYGSGDVPPGLYAVFAVFGAAFLLALYVGYRQKNANKRLRHRMMSSIFTVRTIKKMLLGGT